MDARAKWIGAAVAMLALAMIGHLVISRSTSSSTPIAADGATATATASAVSRSVATTHGPVDTPALPPVVPSDPSSTNPYIGPGKPGALATIPERYELTVTSSGHRAVNLAGGAADVFGFMALARGKRVVRGRVVDRASTPVPGAQVLIDEHGLTLFASSIMATTGATTDADGTFAVDDAPATGVIFALHARLGWSAIAPLTDAPTLVLEGRGALHGRLHHDGHGESFAISLRRDLVTVMYQSDRDGTFTIASLPPGTYTLGVGLAQMIGGGASKHTERDVTIVDGQTTEVDIAQQAGTTVVLLAKPVGDSTMEYWLTKGRGVPADYAALRAKDHAQYLLGGQDHARPAEFHDMEPAPYVACAAGDSGVTFGCVQIVVNDRELVREVEIALTASRLRD